jgi:hypothetical protein
MIGDWPLGVVGDDTAKAVIYGLDLPAGKNAMTWKLTGSLFHHSLLQIRDASPEMDIAVGFDARPKGRAVLPVYRQLMVVGDATKDGSITPEPGEGSHVPLNWSELPQVLVME